VMLPDSRSHVSVTHHRRRHFQYDMSGLTGNTTQNQGAAADIKRQARRISITRLATPVRADGDGYRCTCGRGAAAVIALRVPIHGARNPARSLEDPPDDPARHSAGCGAPFELVQRLRAKEFHDCQRSTDSSGGAAGPGNQGAALELSPANRHPNVYTLLLRPNVR